MPNISTPLHPLQSAILEATSIKDFIDATEALIAENDDIESSTNGNESSLRTTTTRDIIISKAKELFASSSKNATADVLPQRFQSEHEEEEADLDDHNKLVLTVIRLVFLFLLEPANEQKRGCDAGGCCSHDHEEGANCCGGDDDHHHHDHDDCENDDDDDINFMKQVAHMMSPGILDLLITDCIGSPFTRNGVTITVATNVRELYGYGEMFFQAKLIEKENNMKNNSKNNNNNENDDENEASQEKKAANITSEALFPITQELSLKLTQRFLELASSENDYDRSVCEEICGVCLCICCSEFAIQTFQKNKQVVANFIKLFDCILNQNNNNNKKQDDEHGDNDDEAADDESAFSNSTCISFLEVIIHVTSNPTCRGVFLSDKKFLHGIASAVSAPHAVNVFERLAVILNNLSWDSKEMAEFAFTEELFAQDKDNEDNSNDDDGNERKKIFFVDVLIEQLYNCFKTLDDDDENTSGEERNESEGPIAYLMGALSNLILMDPARGRRRLLEEFPTNNNNDGKNKSPTSLLSIFETKMPSLKEIDTRINSEVFFCNVITGSEEAELLYSKHAPFCFGKDLAKKASDDVLGNILATMKRGIEHTPREVKQYQNLEFLRSFKAVFDEKDSVRANYVWLMEKISI